MQLLSLTLPVLALWLALAWTPLSQAEPAPPTPPNTLTEAERAAGWELLFDGKTTKGWRNFGKETIGSDWKVIDGALTLDDANRVVNDQGHGHIPDGGDIITTRQFENFELMLEWKISPCGNSGIMFNVLEGDEYRTPWQTGPELQVLDNTCHPDAKIHTHRAGDLYDLIACSEETVKPAGEWNEVRLRIDDGHLQKWLNGTLVVETQLWDENWDKMVAESKFKDMADFGTARRGHISLQDHSDRVAFRNIKVREF